MSSSTVATVLVKRGTLKTGDVLVAGTAYAKVRTLTDDKGKAVKQALPGYPVTVTGWRDLPNAGDQVLGVPKQSEALAKQALANRKRRAQLADMVDDLSRLNEIHTEAATISKDSWKAKKDFKTAWALYKAGNGPMPEKVAVIAAPAFTAKKTKEEEDGVKVLNLVVKGDVSGTVEAVVETLSGIGNQEVRTKIAYSGVGDITPGDIELAETLGG